MAEPSFSQSTCSALGMPHIRWAFTQPTTRNAPEHPRCRLTQPTSGVAAVSGLQDFLFSKLSLERPRGREQGGRGPDA